MLNEAFSPFGFSSCLYIIFVITRQLKDWPIDRDLFLLVPFWPKVCGTGWMLLNKHGLVQHGVFDIIKPDNWHSSRHVAPYSWRKKINKRLFSVECHLSSLWPSLNVSRQGIFHIFALFFYFQIAIRLESDWNSTKKTRNKTIHSPNGILNWTFFYFPITFKVRKRWAKVNTDRLLFD